MANIVLCDRCGKIATARVAGGCDYWPNPDSDRRTFMLCPDCARELYDFLTEANNETRAILTAFDPEKERTNEGPTQADTSRAALEAEYGDDPR